jgi:hypothetical protein
MMTHEVENMLGFDETLPTIESVSAVVRVNSWCINFTRETSFRFCSGIRSAAIKHILAGVSTHMADWVFLCICENGIQCVTLGIPLMQLVLPSDGPAISISCDKELKDLRRFL